MIDTLLIGPQLNVKTLLELKQMILNKYELEFYPWLNENWDKFTRVKEAGITQEQWLEDPWYEKVQRHYKFYEFQDWSQEC